MQDQVELALMRGEHHKVARAYVLYREERATERATGQPDGDARDRAVAADANGAKALSFRWTPRVSPLSSARPAPSWTAFRREDDRSSETQRNLLTASREDELRSRRSSPPAR